MLKDGKASWAAGQMSVFEDPEKGSVAFLWNSQSHEVETHEWLHLRCVTQITKIITLETENQYGNKIIKSLDIILSSDSLMTSDD